MKQQIRLNVFETNSSTQHALVIKSDYRNRTLDDGAPEGVKLPEKVQLYKCGWAEMDNMKLNTIENRILWLYNLVLADFEERKILVHFLVCLQKLGINYKLFDFDDDYGFYCDVPSKFTDQIVNHEETLIAFLFSKDIFYDTYADDCGSWEQQCEWEDTICEFINNEDVINLSARC